MNSCLTLLIFLTISFSAFSQSNLPAELKGNWLNANDSIEWIISFQPGFAVYEEQFWDYKSILSKEGKYLLQLSNDKQNRSISVEVKDYSTIILSAGEKGDIRCTKLKAIKPDFKHYDTLGFAGSLLTDDTVTIRGFIEDYDPKIYQTFGEADYLSVLTIFTNNYKTKFDIRPDGRFELKFRSFNPQLIYFAIEGGTYTRAFVYPGLTIMIGFNSKLDEVTRNKEKWADISDWDINHYMGCSGMLSEELLLLNTFYENKLIPPIKKATNMESMSQMAYMRWRKDVYAKEIKSIDSLMVAMRCSEKAVQYMQKSLETDLVADFYRFPVQMCGITQLDPLFIDGIPILPANSETSLICANYRECINYLTFFYRHQFLGGFLTQTFLEYLSWMLKLNTDLEEKNQIVQLINKIKDFQDITEKEHTSLTVSGLYDSTIKQRAREIDNAYYELIQKNWNSISDSVSTKVFIMELDYAMQKNNRGLTAQMYAMQWMLQYGENSPLKPELVAWARQNITHPVLIKYLFEDNKKKEDAASKFSTFAENTFFIEPITSGNDSNAFFQEILDRFKGKVIYIDFWADWCSPCRAGFKPAARLKKELSGRDAVFLYFGIDCKNDNWINVIRSEQLSGYHYWLNKEQGQTLKQKFGISGIPYYLLVDKTGHVSEGEAPPPSGLVEIQEKIEELLKL